MSSADVKQQILMASGPIFAQAGFAKATVREICAAAGVNLAAVNYYFGDKRQLYVETVKRAYELRSSQIPMPIWSTQASPEEKLRGFVLTLIRRMVVLEEAPWEAQLLFREVLHPTDACKTLVENYFRPQMDLLIDILGELLPDQVPLSRRRKIAFSVVGQCMFYRVASDVVSMMVPAEEFAEQFAVDQLGHHIADVILLAVKHSPDAWQEGACAQQSGGEERATHTNAFEQRDETTTETQE